MSFCTDSAPEHGPMQPAKTCSAAILLLSYADQERLTSRIPAQGTSFGCGASMLMSAGVRMIWLSPVAQRTMRPPRPSSPRPGTRPIHFANPGPQVSSSGECSWRLQPAVKASSDPRNVSLSNSNRKR